MESSLKISLTILNISAINQKERENSMTKNERAKNDKDSGKLISPKKPRFSSINPNTFEIKNTQTKEKRTSIMKLNEASTPKKKSVYSKITSEDAPFSNIIKRKNSLNLSDTPKSANRNQPSSKRSKSTSNSPQKLKNSSKFSTINLLDKMTEINNYKITNTEKANNLSRFSNQSKKLIKLLEHEKSKFNVKVENQNRPSDYDKNDSNINNKDSEKPLKVFNKGISKHLENLKQVLNSRKSTNEHNIAIIQNQISNTPKKMKINKLNFKDISPFKNNKESPPPLKGSTINFENSSFILLIEYDDDYKKAKEVI